jgi:hypothetical protein
MNPTPNLRYYTAPAESDSRRIRTDGCVYGGTSGGIAAAVALKRLGHTVVVIETSAHLGGMTAGGLSLTDIGNKQAIGGISREFYRRCGQRYGVDEEWRFEPHVAEAVFEEMIQEEGIPVLRESYLESVVVEGDRIRGIKLESGVEIESRYFIDCSYEGDLMAGAGIPYRVGREDNNEYGELLNGCQVRDLHQFTRPVSGYRVDGDPTSGLLPGIEDGQTVEVGRGDHRLQAYNFRMCLTRRPDIRRPFTRPERYNRDNYILLERVLRAGWREVFHKFDPIRNGKCDVNNHCPVSTDLIGGNYLYPDSNYIDRERIFQEHVAYQQGLVWFLANDPAVPEDVRAEFAEWGLCRDEFTATGGWPHALYVRESRRMIGQTVMTEHHCRGHIVAADPIGLAAYTMDSHNCRRFMRAGRVYNEGDVQVFGFPPYRISYGAILPEREACVNLAVPYCLSASHIAFGSIRMEPVFMILSQSAAIAAALAMQAGDAALQGVPYEALAPALVEAGQVLEDLPMAGEVQSGD